MNKNCVDYLNSGVKVQSVHDKAINCRLNHAAWMSVTSMYLSVYRWLCNFWIMKLVVFQFEMSMLSFNYRFGFGTFIPFQMQQNIKIRMESRSLEIMNSMLFIHSMVIEIVTNFCMVNEIALKHTNNLVTSERKIKRSIKQVPF